MIENAIISEIHQHREALARRCDFDVEKLIAHYRHQEAQRNDPLHPLATPEESKSHSTHQEPLLR